MQPQTDPEAILKPTLNYLGWDYCNAWQGPSYLFHFDGKAPHPSKIDLETLGWILESYDCPLDPITHEYKVGAGLKSSYEIETFLVRCRVMLTWEPSPTKSFPLDQIERSGVLRPLDEAGERVNEALRGLDRIKKMRYAGLTYKQAAEAMLQDEESLNALNLVRARFKELIDFHSRYRI